MIAKWKLLLTNIVISMIINHDEEFKGRVGIKGERGGEGGRRFERSKFTRHQERCIGP